MERGASAVAYSPERDRFLLVKRADSKGENPGKWEFPGGIVESNESPRDTALRELKEETNLDGVIIRSGASGLFDSGETKYKVTPFLVKVEGNLELSREHSKYAWVTLEDIERYDTIEGIRSELRALDLLEEKRKVAAAVTRDSATGKLLILKRDKLMRENPGKWEFPSGRVQDETVEEAALRELREETGLEGTPELTGAPFDVVLDGETNEISPVLVEVKEMEVELSFEHSEYRWIEPGELEKYETVPGLQNDLRELNIL